MEKTVLYENIDRLVQYGLTTGLTSEEEEIYTRNQLLEVFGEEDYQENDKTGKEVCWIMRQRQESSRRTAPFTVIFLTPD